MPLRARGVLRFQAVKHWWGGRGAHHLQQESGQESLSWSSEAWPWQCRPLEDLLRLQTHTETFAHSTEVLERFSPPLNKYEPILKSRNTEALMIKALCPRKIFKWECQHVFVLHHHPNITPKALFVAPGWLTASRTRCYAALFWRGLEEKHSLQHAAYKLK